MGSTVGTSRMSSVWRDGGILDWFGLHWFGSSWTLHVCRFPIYAWKHAKKDRKVERPNYGGNGREGNQIEIVGNPSPPPPFFPQKIGWVGLGWIAWHLRCPEYRLQRGWGVRAGL